MAQEMPVLRTAYDYEGGDDAPGEPAAAEEGNMSDDGKMPEYAGDENMGYNGKCGCSVARGWNWNEDLNKCCWCFPIWYCGFIWTAIGMVLTGLNAATVLYITWFGSAAPAVKGAPVTPAPTAQNKIVMTLNMIPFAASGVMVFYYLICSKDREIPVKAVQLQIIAALLLTVLSAIGMIPNMAAQTPAGSVIGLLYTLNIMTRYRDLKNKFG